MAEPRPCPFCPGPTEISWDFEPGESRSVPREFRYYCNECDATGPVRSSQLEALAAWNRRADGRVDPKTELPDGCAWVLFRLRDDPTEMHYGEFRDPRDWRDGDDGFHCRVDACQKTYPIADVLCWMPEPPPPGEGREESGDG